MASKKWRVEIVAYEGDKVVKTMEAMSERQAEKLERGVSINMNHENYYTRVFNLDVEAVIVKVRGNQSNDENVGLVLDGADTAYALIAEEECQLRRVGDGWRTTAG